MFNYKKISLIFLFFSPSLLAMEQTTDSAYCSEQEEFFGRLQNLDHELKTITCRFLYPEFLKSVEDATGTFENFVKLFDIREIDQLLERKKLDGKIAKVKKILNHIAFLNTKDEIANAFLFCDKKGNTALILACKSVLIPLIQLLFSYWKDFDLKNKLMTINAKNKSDKTALKYLPRNYIKYIKMLTKNVFNTSAIDIFFSHIAQLNNNEQVELIKSFTPSIFYILCHSAEVGYLTFANDILKNIQKLNINAQKIIMINQKEPCNSFLILKWLIVHPSPKEKQIELYFTIINNFNTEEKTRILEEKSKYLQELAAFYNARSNAEIILKEELEKLKKDKAASNKS